jgi:hypothetical protein
VPKKDRTNTALAKTVDNEGSGGRITIRPPIPGASPEADYRGNAFQSVDSIKYSPDLSIARRRAFAESKIGFLQSKNKGLYIDNAKSGYDNYLLQGIVVDQHNMPLAGASLSIKNYTGVSTITDNNGQFSLTLRGRDSLNRVIVNYSGYKTESLAINNRSVQPAGLASNVIQLQPENPRLEEVVVFRNNDEKVAPLTGWVAYNDYLEKNKQVLTADSTLRGDETISFIVNQKGELSSFKVEKSLSLSHDSTLIRLIRQGPAWKLIKGNKARARVTVSF